MGIPGLFNWIQYRRLTRETCFQTANLNTFHSIHPKPQALKSEQLSSSLVVQGISSPIRESDYLSTRLLGIDF